MNSINTSQYIPALADKAHLFAEHLIGLVDGLPAARQESMSSMQAFYSGQVLEEQLSRAAHAQTRAGYRAALSSAVAEARTAGYWLDALSDDVPEAAWACVTLHAEADELAEMILETNY